MYKTGSAFTYLLLTESVANDLINVTLFAPGSGRPRTRRPVSACVNAEGMHFEHCL